MAPCRAHETRHPNGLIDDPFAARLAAERGEDLFAAYGNGLSSSLVSLRSALVDEVLLHVVFDHHIHTVADLAPGLDPRPYRLNLPRDLRWVEVDREAVHDYEALRLAHATPCCQFRRVAADLADASDRNRAIRDIAKYVTHGLVLTDAPFHELPRAAVEHLIDDLGDVFKLWIVAGPRLMLDRVTRGLHSRTEVLGSMEEVLALFENYGWKPAKYAALEDQARRLPSDRAIAVDHIRSEVDSSLAGAWLLRYDPWEGRSARPA